MVVEFHITTPNVAKNIKPLSAAAIKVLTEDDSEQALEYVNEHLKTTKNPKCPNSSGSQPQTTQVTSTHTPVQRWILREIEELEEIQKLNPICSQQDRQKLLENFKWDDSQLDDQNRKTSRTYLSNTTTYLPATAWTLASTMTSK